MLALVIIDTVLVVLMAGLVAGLLRSHTEIMEALRSLQTTVRSLSRSRAGPGGPREEAADGTPQLHDTERPVRAQEHRAEVRIRRGEEEGRHQPPHGR